MQSVVEFCGPRQCCHLRGRFMADVGLVAESVFDRNRRREAEIDEALKQEAARHEAAVKNMHRLRAL
jgi:hypothetical protein